MRLAVRVVADEVLIELRGIAGRQQRILDLARALRDGLPGTDDEPASPPTSVQLRTLADAMTIRVKSQGADPVRPDTIYGWLRRSLIDAPAAVPA